MRQYVSNENGMPRSTSAKPKASARTTCRFVQVFFASEVRDSGSKQGLALQFFHPA